MRVLFAIALIAGSLACSARAPAGPTWPTQAARDADGGESLAPHAAARAIAAAVEDDRPADKPAGPAPAAAAAATGERPPATPPQPEEPFPTEELIIEVEE